MDAEIYLHHILFLQNHFVTSIRSIVGSTMIDAKPSRKAHSSFNIVSLFQAWVARQCSHTIFDTLSNFCQGHSRLDVLLCPLPDLPMDFGSMPIFSEKIVVHAIKMTLLLVRCPEVVLITVLLNLTFGILPSWEEGRYKDSGRVALSGRTSSRSLLLLGLSLLFLLGDCS